MALISCSECGREISDKASSCPYCGAPVEKQVGDIILQRKSSVGPIYSVTVFIDGKETCQMKDGETRRIEVPFGTHTVDLSIKGKPSYSETLVVDSSHREAPMAYTLTMGMTSPSIKKSTYNAPTTSSIGTSAERRCPKCNGLMSIQTVAVPHKSGCLGVLLYIILAITIIGIPIMIIILLLRKKSDTKTIAVCQNCGYQIQLNQN